MQLVKRFPWESAEYAEAFATLGRCSRERVYVRQLLHGIVSAYPVEAHAVDWGAGRGDLTSTVSHKSVSRIKPRVTHSAGGQPPVACRYTSTQRDGQSGCSTS